MNDDFKKLGYRLRPRVVEQKQPGRIAFDERGNAVYEWSDDRLSEDGEAGERARRKALDHPTLSFVEEEQRNNAPIQNNAKGLRLGYNPYESGLLPNKAARQEARPARVVEVDRDEEARHQWRWRVKSDRELPDLFLMAAAKETPQLG